MRKDSNKNSKIGMPDSTSKINPRKFFGMGPGPLEKRVDNNSKKITLLKNILQAQKIDLGEKLKGLSPGSMSLDESIRSITDSVTSISQTLLDQQELDKGQADDDRIEDEQQRRNLKESLSEKDGGKTKKKGEGIKKAIAPVGNFLKQIGQWLLKLFAAKAVIELVGWFSDPANKKKVSQIFRFIKDWWPALLTGILLFAGSMLGPAGLIIGVGALIIKFLPKLIQTVKTLFGFGKATERDAKKLEQDTKTKGDAVDQETGQDQKPSAGDIKNLKEPGQFNLGGLVPGQGNEDSVPAMLTPGEFVMSKDAVGHWGKGTLAGMNAAGGGKNSGNPLVGYKEGGEVPEMNKPTKRLFNRVAPLTGSDDGKPKGFMRGLAGFADTMTGGFFDFDKRGGGGADLLSKGKDLLGNLFKGKKDAGGGSGGGEGKEAIQGFVKTLESIPFVGKTISKAGNALVTGIEGMIKHQYQVLHKSSVSLSGDQSRGGSVGAPTRPSTTVAYSDAMDAAGGAGGAGNTASPGGDIPDFSAGAKISSQKIKVLGITR